MPKRTLQGLVKGLSYLPHIPEGLLIIAVNTLALPFTSVETRGQWINNIRDVFNRFVPGGSMFGDDSKFAAINDNELKEIINPEVTISKTFVEPLTTPLHEVSQGLTDWVTFIAYSAYPLVKGVTNFLSTVFNRS